LGEFLDLGSGGLVAAWRLDLKPFNGARVGSESFARRLILDWASDHKAVSIA
jgi:hypothetical protein